MQGVVYLLLTPLKRDSQCVYLEMGRLLDLDKLLSKVNALVEKNAQREDKNEIYSVELLRYASAHDDDTKEIVQLQHLNA